VLDPSQLFTCSAAGIKIGFGSDGSITHLERGGVSDELLDNCK
jgi:hypothetical protein